MFNVRHLVTAIFRTDIRGFRRGAHSDIANKLTVPDLSNAVHADVRYRLKADVPLITFDMPLAINVLQGGSDVILVKIATGNLDHSRTGLDAAIAIYR